MVDFFTDLAELLLDYGDDGLINQSVGDFADNQAMDGSVDLSGVDVSILAPETTGLF